MQAVEKIESLGYTTSFKSNYIRINPKTNSTYYHFISWINYNSEGWGQRKSCVNFEEDNENLDLSYIDEGKNIITKLDAIYKAVVQFIEWYNNKGISDDIINEALDRFNGYWANDFTVCDEIADKYKIDRELFKGKVFKKAKF